MNDSELRDLERRLSSSLRSAAPRPDPGLADRMLGRTAMVDQRRGFLGMGFGPLLAAAFVVVMAVIAGVGIASSLPIAPKVGDDPTPPPASAAPTDPAPADSREPAPSPGASDPQPSTDPTAGWPRCENEELGIAVSYPPDWWVQEAARPDPALDPLPGCTYFAPEPVEIRQNAGLPATVAVVFGLTEQPLGDVEQPIRVISSRDLVVAGQPATVEEIEWTEGTVFQSAGERAYGYRISLPNGDELAAGVGSAVGDYVEEKRVLDLMVETLELVEP